ncbi:MAG: MFS transporter [Chloroflexi bacterium]|nr:MAG: MFS transporter [Chloroflexota bacterium]
MIFLSGGALLLLAMIPVLLVVRESPRPLARRAPVRTMEVLRMARAGTIGALTVLMLAQGLLQTSYGAAQQLVVLRLLELTSAKDAQSLTGITFAAAGIATALASITYSRLLRRSNYRTLITVGATLLGLALLGSAAATTVPFVITSFVIAGFVNGALIPAFGAMIGLEAPAIVQATIFGVGSSAISLGFGLGPLIGGFVASAAGIRAGLIVAAALAFVLTALVGLGSREPLHAR